MQTINLDRDLDVDAEMDSLDFGLFHTKPSPWQLIRESMPIVWIGLVSIWPVLLSGFLRLLWCVPFEVDEGKTSYRLLPNPDIVCESGSDESDAYGLPARIAVSGLMLWCIGIPLALVLRVLWLSDRQAPDTQRRYGYFIQASRGSGEDCCRLKEAAKVQFVDVT